MTKKHFEAMAARFRELLEDTEGLMIRHGVIMSIGAFVTIAAESNGRFDPDRFKAACGL